MIRRNVLFALAFLLMVGTLSSCFLWHDKNRADRGRRFPHDDPKQRKQQEK